MDYLDEEILKLWSLLHKHEVEYIMVGGFAVSLHGFNRMTEDVDLWIKDSKVNRIKLRKALNELGIGDFQALERTELVPGFTSIKLNSGVELDLMTSLKGLDQIKFEECFLMAPTAIIEDIPVKFLHLNTLIEAKLASARPKDLIDAEELKKIRDQEIK